MEGSSTFWILYANAGVTRQLVFQTSVNAKTITDARERFDRTYNAQVVAIQRGRKFGPRAINKYKILFSK